MVALKGLPVNLLGQSFNRFQGVLAGFSVMLSL